MARRKDAEEDAPSKAILDQLQTKTVGPPPTSTGLIGDQKPETVFSVNDFDQVSKQVTLQLSNLELLNVLNTVGQVTNTQSQSGVIVGGGEIQTGSITGAGSSGRQPLLTGKSGQVFLLQAANASCSTSPGATITYGFFLEQISTGTAFLIGTLSSSSTDVALTSDEIFRTPTYVDEDFKISVSASTLGSATSITLECYAVRVR